MVGCLGPKLHLAQALVGVPGRLGDGVPEEVRIHEVGAGAGRKEASVPDQAQAALVDLAVAPDGCLDGVSGLREGGGIQDHDIEELSLPVKGGKKVKDVRALIAKAGAGIIDQPGSGPLFC